MRCFPTDLAAGQSSAHSSLQWPARRRNNAKSSGHCIITPLLFLAISMMTLVARTDSRHNDPMSLPLSTCSFMHASTPLIKGISMYVPLPDPYRSMVSSTAQYFDIGSAHTKGRDFSTDFTQAFETCSAFRPRQCSLSNSCHQAPNCHFNLDFCIPIVISLFPTLGSFGHRRATSFSQGSSRGPPFFIMNSFMKCGSPLPIA